MSALPPKADIPRGEQYVRFVPIADTFLATLSLGRRHGDKSTQCPLLPPKADINRKESNVRFVPEADMTARHYSGLNRRNAHPATIRTAKGQTPANGNRNGGNRVK
jgi:hypothetical protein